MKDDCGSNQQTSVLATLLSEIATFQINAKLSLPFTLNRFMRNASEGCDLHFLPIRM